MKSHTLSREEIEILREELLRDFEWMEDGRIRLNVLCDMALECMEARVKSLRPEAALMTDEVEETMKRLRSQIPGCDCDNPAQCWEPCGTLGHSEKHMKVVKE